MTQQLYFLAFNLAEDKAYLKQAGPSLGEVGKPDSTFSGDGSRDRASYSSKGVLALLADGDSGPLQPKEFMKNRRDHVIVLNDVARQVIESRRGKHKEFVFTYQGECISRMSNNGWQRARKAAGMPHVRIHDLRHTFGSRLRAAGVSVEDREDLLGHKSARMTTHYSAAQLSNLIEAANKVCEQNGQTPTLTMLRKSNVAYLYRHRSGDLGKSRKSPASGQL